MQQDLSAYRSEEKVLFILTCCAMPKADKWCIGMYLKKRSSSHNVSGRGKSWKRQITTKGKRTNIPINLFIHICNASPIPETLCSFVLKPQANVDGGSLRHHLIAAEREAGSKWLSQNTSNAVIHNV